MNAFRQTDAFLPILFISVELLLLRGLEWMFVPLVLMLFPMNKKSENEEEINAFPTQKNLDFLGYSKLQYIFINNTEGWFWYSSVSKWTHHKLGLAFPGPRIRSKSMHWFPKIHGYEHGYTLFLDVSLQLSIQAWISTLISKHGYPCKDISQWISVNNKYP